MIAAMAKVQVAVARTHDGAVLRWLQERGVLHLTPVTTAAADISQTSPDEAVAPYKLQLATIQFALEFIDRVRGELHARRRQGLRYVFVRRPSATLKELEAVLQRLDVPAVVDEIRVANDTLTDLAASSRAAGDDFRQLTPWRELSHTGAELAGTAAVRHALVAVSLPEEPLFRQALSPARTAAVQLISSAAEKKKDDTSYLMVVIHRSESPVLDGALAATGAEEVILSVPNNVSVAVHAARLEQRVKADEASYREMLRAAQRFLKLEPDLQFAYDALLHRQERAAARQLARYLPLSVVLEGWAPRAQLDGLTADFQRAFPAGAIAEVPAGPRDEPPVLFRNSRLLSPFETVTNIYGRPRYEELDPTPYLSLFFLLAFGLALTDAGYGLVMMGMTWMAERFFHLKREMRKMVRLLFYGGAATVVLGALTGGWFGVVLEDLPPGVVREGLLAVKLIDPVTSPLVVLGVAFGIGVVQLLAAWVVRGYDHYRKGQYLALVFDDIAWVTMVLSVLLWQASVRGFWLPSIAGTLSGVVVINAAVLVLTQGRSYKNPLLKLGAGLLSLYGLVGFLSDVLSYSRLLALGLATGIIALVVNLLGSMIAESVPYLGWLLAAAVLVVGHVFNLGINALGAFIHSGRLQFVEFFPKFIEGGGAPFRPLGRVSRYVDNPQEFV